MTLVPLVQSASEADLYYQTYNPTDCVIRVRNDNTLAMTSYPISAKVSVSGNNIMRTFDGRPLLPITYPSTIGETFNCQTYGLSYGYPGFWELVRNGQVQYTLEYCPIGITDPPGDGIVNYKCNGLCHPNQAVCVDAQTLKSCSSDGSSVSTTTCDYQCSNNACISRDFSITVNTDKSAYNFGDAVNVLGKLQQPLTQTPIYGVLVTAQILKNGAVIKEGSKTTDSSGNVIIGLNDVELVGDVEIRLIATYQSKTISQSKTVTFVGQPIVYKVSAFSYTQYDSNPIKFLVELKDNNGNDIYPDKISAITPVTSISNGIVQSNTATYLGKGLYEISSVVNGVGKFTGKLQFTYQGTTQSSPIIEINVEKISISIDTSKIPSSGYLNDQMNFTIKIFDPEGNPLTPDNIQVKASYPDGTTVKTISFSQITKVAEGEYQFPFYFQQVEKHTFLITVDKIGYIRGSATVTVAIAGKADVDAGPSWFSSLPTILVVGSIAFFAIAFYLSKKRRRR